MPAKMNMKSVKDRLKDETLDLSLCDLEEVPVREIAAVRKASYLDLSSNLLVSLPPTFATLKQIVKLDLSRNNLTEIPENFGEMKQLRHLDLYANQISRLPLSLGELKNLRWLDLKENPLAPAVASVAGPCSNMAECQACAKNIVKYLSNAKQTIDEEKLKRLNSATANPETENAANKKESKKKKKKSEEKDKKKNVNKTDSKTVGDKLSQSNTHNKNNTNKNTSGNRSHKNSKSRRSVCHQIILSLVWTILFFFTLFLMLAILPKYFEQQSKEIFNYVEARTGVPMKTFQRQSADALAVSVQTATEWGKIIYDNARMTYEKHFK